MKKLFFILLCCISVTASAKTEQMLDQIVAVVNDDVITTSEYKQTLNIVKAEMAQNNIPLPAESVLKQKVLDQLIDKKLQLQVVHQSGVQVSEAEINQAIERIALQNNMPVSDLYKRIHDEGINTAEYRNKIQEQMALQKVQQQELSSHISITQQEIANYMRSKLWQTNATKEYHLEEILIPLNDTPSTEEIVKARAHANAVFAKLKSGKNFKEVAQIESSDKNALQGGDLGWRKMPEIPSAFASQVATLRDKEIAGPIQTPNGFHIIHLVQSRALGNQSAPDKKQIEQLLLQQKFEEATQNWVSKLRSQAFIKTDLG